MLSGLLDNGGDATERDERSTMSFRVQALSFTVALLLPVTAKADGEGKATLWDLGSNGSRSLVLKYQYMNSFSLEIVDPAGVAPSFPLIEKSSFPSWALWWKDGKEVLYVDPNGRLTVFREDGSREPWGSSEIISQVRVPRWAIWLRLSGDGRFLFLPFAQDLKKADEARSKHDKSYGYSLRGSTREESPALLRIQLDGLKAVAALAVFSPGMPLVSHDGQDVVFAEPTEDPGGSRVCRYNFPTKDLTCGEELQRVEVRMDHFFQPWLPGPLEESRLPEIARFAAQIEAAPDEVMPGTRGRLFVMQQKRSPTTGAVVGEERRYLGDCVITSTTDQPECVASNDIGANSAENVQVEVASVLDGTPLVAQVLRLERRTEVELIREFQELSGRPAPRITHARIRPLGFPPPRPASPKEVSSRATCVDISFSLPGTNTWISCWEPFTVTHDTPRLIDGYEYIFRDAGLYGLRTPIVASSDTAVHSTLERIFADGGAAAVHSKKGNEELEKVVPPLRNLYYRLNRVMGRPEVGGTEVTDVTFARWSHEGEAVALVQERGDSVPLYVYYLFAKDHELALLKDYKSIPKKVKNEPTGYRREKWLSNVDAVRKRFPSMAKKYRCEAIGPGAGAAVECWKTARRGGGTLEFVFGDRMLVAYVETIPVTGRNGHRRWINRLIKKHGTPNRIYGMGNWEPRRNRTEDPPVPIRIAWVGDETELTAIVDPKKTETTLMALTMKWRLPRRLALTGLPNPPYQGFVYDPARGNPAARGTTEILSRLQHKVRPVRVPGYTSITMVERDLERLRESNSPLLSAFDFNNDGVDDHVLFVTVAGRPRVMVVRGDSKRPSIWHELATGYRIPAYVNRGEDAVVLYWYFHTSEADCIVPKGKRRFRLSRGKWRENDDGESSSPVCR
jgi:hypothetical protein